MSETPLRELAALYGISVECRPTDIEHADEEDSLVAILQAAGLPLTATDDADTLLQQIRLQQWQQTLDPVQVVAESDMPPSVQIRLPGNDEHQYQWVLTEETGNLHSGSFMPVELPVVSDFQAGGVHHTLYRLELTAALPCGYHQFTVQPADQPEGTSSASLLLIVVPRQCHVPPGITGEGRIWGISTHLHTIRSRNNWGIGDFSDLQRLLSWGAAQGAGTVHTAPLHCLSPESSESANPYAPSCRSQLNVLLIDVEAMPDFAECDEAKSHTSDARFQARLAYLRNQDQIDYDAVFRIKEELFKKLWNHFSTNQLNPETGRGSDFRRFQQQGGNTLHFFALFSALLEEFSSDNLSGKGWRTWPAPFRNPLSEAVTEFAQHHENEIEYHQYLQWQADLQLAAIGRRSMEFGLKVGLLGEFSYSPGLNGFETWYYGKMLLGEALVDTTAPNTTAIDPAVGLPFLAPNSLRENRYQPFIAGLRHNMMHTGALIIRSIANYFQTHFSLTGQSGTAKSFIRFPFSDLLGIVALESQRNCCLVIADHIELLPEEQQTHLRQRNIFSSNILFQTRDDQGNWLEAADYPANSVISSTAPFLSSLKGFWQGRDIAVKTTENFFLDDAEKETAILCRASDRAHFLISLEHEGLLPEGYGLDPAAVPDIDHSLITAGQVLLARSPAKILLVSLNDLLGMADQAEPPSMACQQFWKMRLAVELDTVVVSQDIESLLFALCRERGVGVVRPSAPATDRRKRQGLKIPTAFYRLQLHKGFTFLQAAEIIPYLKLLGISHCYVPPFLMSRPGSPHGYDIINHGSLNPEIGNREDFEKLIAALDQHHMALLIDIVPNHMGIGSDNLWWMDVLENGETSLYAHFFDINWQPQQADMAGRLLLPVLGDHYGKILESGRLTLDFLPNSGNFTIQYYDQRFPVDPGTCTAILHHDLQRLSNRLGKQHNGYLELQNLISSFDNLPGRRETSAEKAHVRQRDKEVNKRILARLCREFPEIKQFIDENIILFNGEPGKPESFDLLHILLEKQAYRLAFWRVAADVINYRRFFDINDLAGLRIEEQKVFRETHKLILDLIATGKVDGLRVDHPDGLYDPHEYFCRLETAAAGGPLDIRAPVPIDSSTSKQISLYIVAEKVLADFEHLPETWPVSGTTGYEFSHMLNGLFIDASTEKAMTSLYHQFIGGQFDFETIVYNSKKLIIRSAMAGELNVLAGLLYRLAQSIRATRDFTLNRLREGLTEIVACFPVYRTYIASSKINKYDVHFIKWAVAKARTRQPFIDVSIFDFIQGVLLLENMEQKDSLEKRLDFVMKFQQYTGPVMAKGLEDTSFYIYNRLLSLNEVGSDPKSFGISVAAFHRANKERLHYWPHSMLNSSTHDSKRSEDVRARINVLSEMAPQWRQHVFRWSKLNRPMKSQLEGLLAPTRNDEYAYYQNLLGAWPIGLANEQGYQKFIERMKESTLKACRESKTHTSWIYPDQDYENAVIRFVEGTLSAANNVFLTDFISFQNDISWFGMLNSLSQVFLKLLAPGIPDIYQGNEIWQFCLVDPDNRRPVDFQKRQAMLFALLEQLRPDATGLEELQHELLTNLTDGRAKMYLIHRTLQLRNSWPDIFERSSYLQLDVTGSKSKHLCAFARKSGERMIVVVVPRLYLTLMQGIKELPLGEKVWADTQIHLPAGSSGIMLQNIYADTPENNELTDNDMPVLQAGNLLRSWPVALLKGTVQR